jgi:hypothetical protein
MNKVLRLGSLVAGLAVIASADRLASAPDPIITSIHLQGTNVVVEWQPFNKAVLQIASDVNGPWESLTNAPAPFTTPVSVSKMLIFRLRYEACTNQPCPG